MGTKRWHLVIRTGSPYVSFDGGSRRGGFLTEAVEEFDGFEVAL